MLLISLVRLRGCDRDRPGAHLSSRPTELASQLDAQERSMMQEAGVDSAHFLKYMAEDSGNVAEVRRAQTVANALAFLTQPSHTRTGRQLFGASAAKGARVVQH